MFELNLGLFVLIGIHLLPTWPPLRRRAVSVTGERGYQVAFSVISLIGLVLIVMGMGQAPRVNLWQPPAWGQLVPQALMLPAFILLLAAYVPGNLKRVTPNPMLWAVILWSVGHLMANGDLAALLLFGSLGLYAVYDMISTHRRGAHPVSTRGPLLGDAVSIVGGVLLYLLILMNHASLFGVAVVG